MSNVTDEEIRAFVGTGATYYLDRWQPALEGGRTVGNTTGFNWAALFLSGLWLPFRKMYRAAGIFYGVLLLETLLEEVLYVGVLGKPEAPGSFGSFFGLIAGMVCGGFGNEWYLSHTQKAIDEVRSQGLAEDSYLQALAKRGGTSYAASLGFLVLFLVAVLFIVSLTGALFG